MNQPTDKRIKRMINSLLPATGFEGKLDSPRTLRDRLAHYHTPGVSIAVINDFEIEWAQGFGVCDARAKKKVTTRTLFQAGSISKPIFALGVMQLVQEGQLSLANIQDCTGLYSSKAGTQFRISALDDNLVLQHGQQPPLPIFATSEVEFFAKALNGEIHFEKDSHAGVVSLTISQGGNQIKADKQVTEQA